MTDMQQGQPQMNERKKRNILLAIIAVLAIIGIGVGAYFYMADSRYAAKCQEAEKVVTDVRDFTKEIDDLKGDPEGDDVKDYLDRLGKAESNLDKLAGDLRSMRISGKNEGRNKNLVEAILTEKDILSNVKTVLKNPADKQTGDVINKVKSNVSELDDRAGQLDFGTVDFASAMQLDGLDERLKGYVQKKQALDAAKKAEEARKAHKVTQLASQTVGGAIATDTVTSRDESADITRALVPVVHLDNAAVEQKINDDIRRSIASILPASKEGLEWEKLTYEVKSDSEETLSIVIRENYLPQKAMHDAIRYAALNYDKKTGARRGLAEYSSITPQEAQARAQAELISYNGGKDATRYYQKGALPTLGKFFVTQDGHAWLLFDPYEMAAFAAGATCIQIK